MMKIYRCRLTLLEPTFFSSREVSNYFQTAPLVGNYALAYALGLCQSPYFNDGTIHYAQHLAALNERGIYVTPATLTGVPRFTLAQFNAQPDAYWYAMGGGVIVTRPDDGYVVGAGKTWRVSRGGGKLRKIGAENRPQHGRIRFLSIGNQAVCYLLSREPYKVPTYIRLGKFMSKARVEAEEVAYTETEAQNVTTPFLLNPADLSPETELVTFDLVSVPPTPLVQNGVMNGRFYRLSDKIYLPIGMRFGIESLS